MRLGAVAITAVVVAITAGCADRREQTTPMWQAELTLRLGDINNADYTFNRIGSIAFDRGGRIYVADQGDLRVRVYGRDGRHVRDFGRAGEGPGEFRSISGAGVLRDTIWVADSRQNRLTYFDTLGNALATVTSTARYDDPRLRPGVPSLLLEDGAGLLMPAFPAGRTEPVPQLIVRRDGSILDTVGFHDPAVGGIGIVRPSGALYVAHVFPYPAFQATSPKGSFRAEARAAPLDGLGPGRYKVVVMTLKGDTLWNKIFESEPRPFPRRIADSMVAARYESLPDHSLTEQEFRDAVAVPEYEPPIAGLWLSDEGVLWLKHSRVGGSIATWSVADTMGRIVAHITLPARTAPKLMEGDTLWAVDQDEMDVPTVVRYHIRK